MLRIRTASLFRGSSSDRFKALTLLLRLASLDDAGFRLSVADALAYAVRHHSSGHEVDRRRFDPILSIASVYLRSRVAALDYDACFVPALVASSIRGRKGSRERRRRLRAFSFSDRLLEPPDERQLSILRG